jgi:hypothetical protein
MATALWSCHPVLRSDETWLPEWSGKLDGVKRWAVRSRGLSWGKPVFRLTASSQLAESLARGRVQFQRDGTSTRRNGDWIDAECRLSGFGHETGLQRD